jgi:hypothetical protein
LFFVCSSILREKDRERGEMEGRTEGGREEGRKVGRKEGRKEGRKQARNERKTFDISKVQFRFRSLIQLSVLGGTQPVAYLSELQFCHPGKGRVVIQNSRRNGCADIYA